MSTLSHNFFFIGCYSIDDQALPFIASIVHDLLSTLSMLFVKSIHCTHCIKTTQCCSDQVIDMGLNCIGLPSLARTTQTKLARQCNSKTFPPQCKMSGYAGGQKKVVAPADRGLSIHVLNSTLQHTASSEVLWQS